ncbi:MAG: hypothetical protein ACLF0G_17555 [Candidatus Brocadiia bacterium]
MSHRTVVALLLAAGAALGAELPRADDPGHFTPADELAMVRLARQALAGESPRFDPQAMPAKLLRSTGQPLILSAHRPGTEPRRAVARRGTLFEQLAAAGAVLRRGEGLGPVAELRLKVDIVRSPQPISLARLGPRDEPVLGIHGLRLRSGEAELVLPPSDALRLGLAEGEAFVRHALERLAVPGGRLAEVEAERFAVVSFIEREPGGGGPPVRLYRARPLVERVTAGRLLAAAEAGADWLVRFQRPDGRFRYVYHAARDAAVDEPYNATRHAGTAWSLAQAFAATGERRFGEGARRALAWLLSCAEGDGEMAWVAWAGERELGAAALAVVALLEYREAAGTRRFDRVIRRLGRFLVAMQRDDGFFWSHYDPQAGQGTLPTGHVPLYAPGEAFLALVRLQRAMPEPAWRRAALAAADFLVERRDEWYAAHDLPAVLPDAWTMMGLDELHALGLGTRRHADYGLFLAHIALEEQLGPAEARWLDHVGAPRERARAPRVGPAASRCEGVLAAWRLARRLGGDTAPYRRFALRSARFQLAHQYGPVNGYLVPQPARARGGFFSSYAQPTVRIDCVQHNLSALLGLAALLADEPGPRKAP